jgi:hypothetical protein
MAKKKTEPQYDPPEDAATEREIAEHLTPDQSHERYREQTIREQALAGTTNAAIPPKTVQDDSFTLHGDRHITAHHDGLGYLNDAIAIIADPPSAQDGASHQYTCTIDEHDDRDRAVTIIQFQDGPRGEPGAFPGVSTAAVIAILIDHLEGFQAGPFACHTNELMLTNLRSALRWEKQRTDDRKTRGVLGTRRA